MYNPNMDTIPELTDPDRAAIQEAVEAMQEFVQEVTEFMDAFVEAIRPVIEAINAFMEFVIETVQRWQVEAVLYRLRVPVDWAMWVSEKIPKRLLLPISIPVIRWCVGLPVAD